MEIWRSGDLEIWRSGDLEIWRSRGLDISRTDVGGGSACPGRRARAWRGREIGGGGLSV